MAKQFGYTASILQDSNKLIASSQADWTTLKDGSLILFEGDQNFYKVIGKEKFFYIKEFEVLSKDEIEVHEDVGIKLTLNDNLALTFKEYEVVSVNILNGGTGFSVGQTLGVKGGIAKFDSSEGIKLSSNLRVTEVNEEGSILSIEVDNGGLYLDVPESSQTIESAELSIDTKISDKRLIETRTISKIESLEDSTVIKLNYELPKNVKKGKLSADKWELILNINYAGKTKINSKYNVITDFTPFLNIPLMNGDPSRYETVFNEAVTKIDEFLSKLNSEK